MKIIKTHRHACTHTYNLVIMKNFIHCNLFYRLVCIFWNVVYAQMIECLCYENSG